LNVTVEQRLQVVAAAETADVVTPQGARGDRAAVLLDVVDDAVDQAVEAVVAQAHRKRRTVWQRGPAGKHELHPHRRALERLERQPQAGVRRDGLYLALGKHARDAQRMLVGFADGRTQRRGRISLPGAPLPVVRQVVEGAQRVPFEHPATTGRTAAEQSLEQVAI
jgi:hypothetical protein